MTAVWTWAPGLAAAGAAGGAASTVSWHKAGPSWLAAAGLGSFWLPLAAGAILSLVLIFREAACVTHPAASFEWGRGRDALVGRADGERRAGTAHSTTRGHEDKEEAVPSLSERRLDAWTALAAEAAVRAAERAIVTGSPAVLADTLAVSTAAECRRRLAHVLELKDRADGDPARRDAYRRAADDLRGWAAAVHLAALREPHECRLRLTGRNRGASPTTAAKPRNPYTEESISLRRSVPRPPFPGQRKRRPFDAAAPAGLSGADRPLAAVSERAAAEQLSLGESEEIAPVESGCAAAVA